MSIQNKGNWTYEYTDENGNRFYKLYDRQNKQLSVLNLRHYKDDLMDMNHVNWEMWRSPSFCQDQDHAETLLEYYDSGIFGSGFLSCLTDSMDPDRRKLESDWSRPEYKLIKEPQFA